MTASSLRQIVQRFQEGAYAAADTEALRQALIAE